MSKKKTEKIVKPQKEKTGKRGHPAYDVNDRVRDSILALAMQGKTDQEIADELGIAKRTLSNWKGKCPDLMQAVEEAKAVADELVEMSLFKRATGYSYNAVKFFMHEGVVLSEPYVEHVPPDTKAAELWLRNRKPDQWKEKKELEVSGSLKLEDLITKSFDDESKPEN